MNNTKDEDKSVHYAYFEYAIPSDTEYKDSLPDVTTLEGFAQQ